ncbi:MAG: hypothetical protein U9Q39_00835 [Pseudomonadota bacterium]|nr:hypothetical protein [Pseudomonadota bacterium]
MVEKKRTLRFLLSLIVIGLLAGLFLLLPLIPQPGLKDRLISEFSQALQQPCQVEKVGLKLLPRPAIEVRGFTCSTSGINLKARSLDLNFSIISLLSLSLRIDGIHLRGVLAELPFTSLFPEDGVDTEAFHLFPGRLKSIIKGKAQSPIFISLHDAICVVSKVPGLNKPLLFTGLEGEWCCQPKNQSESLELTGAVNGGQGRLQVTWYKIDEVVAPESGLTDMDSGDRLEITGRLRGVSLAESGAALWGSSSESRWRADFEKGDLDLDINGDPGAGLRFSGRIALADHHLSRYEISRDSVWLCSQGALKAGLSGFFQPRKGYLNIKNAALEYPGIATLFSRGLIHFRKPLFVDLVNHLKVDDLGQTIDHCPLLDLPGHQCEGALEGDLKLIGNPLKTPVLKIELSSEKIVLRALDPASVNRTPILEADSHSPQLDHESGESTTSKPTPDGRSRLSDYQDMTVNFLQSLAKWEWIVKSDFQIGLLELPGLQLAELSFLAEKTLVQLEIERLAARFGKQGQVRLSLILDDFLHGPRWQASLVAEKFDLKPFNKTMSLTGMLDLSLVGGGWLGSDSERNKELVFDGKWQLRQGSFAGQPLFTAFNRFLEQEGISFMSPKFSGFSGKFALRDKILRLDGLEIRSSGRQLKAKGRFFRADERLYFRGSFSEKGSLIRSFSLKGDLHEPIFILER